MAAANAPITMKEVLTPNMVYLLGEQLVNEGVGSLVWGGVDLSTPEAISGIFNSTLATLVVPLSARKGSGGSTEGSAPFLQLPHFSEVILKKIARKSCLALRYEALILREKIRG
ncbi:hypothetical protein IFM89_036896 [Coptis chinensis]|uniref:Uncharacterized protein n=1 Tax=Coptis chinensis TaxID=261450 RepID=A0A835HZ71_9MAGN|nr:hypothetical protein IFM89_036896 [Coptis chinensis]